MTKYKAENKQIESIAIMKTSKGDKYFKLQIEGKTYSVFKDTSAWNKLNNDEISTGDFVDIIFTKTTGSYNGKPVEYKNIEEIELRQKQAEQPEVEVIDASGSKQTQRGDSITRMSCLKSALEYYALNADAIRQQLPEENKVISLEVVINTAKEFERYVKGEWEQ